MDYDQVMARIGEVIDGAGVAVLVIGAVRATVFAAFQLSHHEAGAYRRFRQQLGRTILLGLELLVAGDIVRTVAAQPTLISVGILGLIVVIRTFLSFSLEVELTGRWPWQQPGSSTAGDPDPAAGSLGSRQPEARRLRRQGNGDRAGTAHRARV